jgi:hypothetical protein
VRPPACASLLLFLAIVGFTFPALAETDDGFNMSRQRDQSWSWRTSLAAGFDAFSHNYSLATEDTTESLVEYLFSAAFAGRSHRRARHGGYLKAEGSLGSELFRQLLEGGYRYQDSQRRSRLRLDGRLRGRQYRSGSDYVSTSNNVEGRLRLRGKPWISSRRALELNGSLAFLDYSTPSTLEVNHRTLATGLSLGSEGWGGPIWRVGAGIEGRSYPDSTRIDRRRIIGEGQFEVQGADEKQLLFMHRSERRHIRDETAKPSGWLHWTDFSGRVGAGPGWAFTEWQSEVWIYDQEKSAYNNSWRLEGVAGYGWGDMLGTSWKLGLALEQLRSSDAPEAFTATGLVVGVEAFSGPVNGSISFELGRRDYTDDEASFGEPENTWTDEEYVYTYSDFTYWEIWLMGNWRLNDRFSCEVQASYEPETHTESEDDSALGFATLRLVYRP